jgi:hypothetical protein
MAVESSPLHCTIFLALRDSIHATAERSECSTNSVGMQGKEESDDYLDGRTDPAVPCSKPLVRLKDDR